MTEMHPPAVAEAILESFGADPDFRDAVLGDLAQEYSLRVERVGATAAWLWYYREAALVAPALLRNWFAGARWSDARRLLNVAALAYVTTMLIGMCVFFSVAVIADRFLPGGVRGASRWINGLALISAVASPMIGGYLAATFEEAKPMIGALSLAVLWSILMVLASLWASRGAEGPIHLATWVRVATAPLILAACALGGALRVARVARTG